MKRINKRKPNGYPLAERTILFSRKKRKLKAIPEVGKKYHCFDDGKITFSRHYIIEVSEVLGCIEFKKKYNEQFQNFKEQSKRHYWLFNGKSDKFIITKKGENDEFGVYVRTRNGGWFGIGEWWNCGLLDVNGESYDWLVKNIDMFDYTEEEKKKLIEENAI